MSELNSNIETEIGSEKSFAIVFSIVFLLVALYPLTGGEGLRLWGMLIAVAFLGLAVIAPKVFKIPNLLWFKIGLILGSIVAPVVMGIIYFTVIMPIGLAFKLLRKDVLQQNKDDTSKSYWVSCNKSDSSMKDQF